MAAKGEGNVFPDLHAVEESVSLEQNADARAQVSPVIDISVSQYVYMAAIDAV